METQSTGFLPNFCAIRMVFAVVVTAELLAIVLTLASAAWPERFWEGLGLHSLYIQWVALSSTALLCVLGPFLRRLGHTWGGVVAWCLILVVTAVVSMLAVRYSGAHSRTQAGHWFLIKSLAVSAIVGALVLRYLYEQFRERQRELAAANARLDALQARIRPHFLFNSMNTIAGLTRKDPALAEEVVQDLSDLFRASLSDPARLVTLQDEFDLARAYLQIEAQRLGERLRVTWDVHNVPMDSQVPPLLLQPLLENAVYHGVEPSSHGVAKSARPAGGDLRRRFGPGGQRGGGRLPGKAAFPPSRSCGVNVLIVDDEAPARDRLAALLVDLGPEYSVVGEAANGLEALEICAGGKVDLVLMDISMPGMDGLTAARRLAEVATPPAVVFTTAYAEHALAAFDANAVDYLLKPVRPSRLLAALRRAVRPTRAQLDTISLGDEDATEYIKASYRGGVQRIAIAEVICLHAASKYVEVRHTDGTALIEESLKSLEDRFAGRFLRIHRNALINSAFLVGLERSMSGRFEVVMKGIDLRFEVSRRHLPQVRRLVKGD